MQRAFYEIREVGEMIERTPTRVRQLVAAGELPAVRVGGRIRVPRAAFDAWLARQNEAALAAVRSD